MAATQVGVYNMALGRLGVSIFIESVDEASNGAIACNVYYDQHVDQVLRDFPWNFCTSFATLANLGTPPTNWDYRYALPSDCVNVRRIVIDGVANPRKEQRIPFKLATEGGVRVLYTNQEDAEIEYSARITDLNLWDSLAVSALAWLLASDIAMPLTTDSSKRDAALRGYFAALDKAGAASLRESEEGVEPDSEFIAGRL